MKYFIYYKSKKNKLKWRNQFISDDMVSQCHRDLSITIMKGDVILR